MKNKFLFSVMLLTLMFVSCQTDNHPAPQQANFNPDALPQGINHVEPLCWWTDMKLPLTLMINGEDLADAQVSVLEKGLNVKSQHNAESPNYLFVDLDVQAEGNFTIVLTKGERRIEIPYTILPRRQGSAERKSFTSADVMYLLMPDRFFDGDSTNNETPDTDEPFVKGDIDGRFGGDIQGIIDHFDYIKSLGVTTIWPTPLLLDNEPDWSYHGYACGDYYRIDPRFGNNDMYKQMVSIAHEKGLKIIMDIVTNHSGLAHWWEKDLPYQDWIHQFPEFTGSNNVFTANYDINASQYDLKHHVEGWFDTHMPDMNLDNPDLLQYFKQWAIWWVEWADLDGLRVDTYPYNEKQPMSEWCKAVLNEYPNLNIVGECWTRPASAIAYWQANANNADGFNSNLPCVMDFPVEEAMRQGLENDGNYWGGGMTKIYDAMAMDYQYADPNNMLVFMGNHDMDHIADCVKDNDLRRVKLATTLVATMRGIPQIFSGDEYGQRSADLSKGHSGLRQMIPADFSTLTPEQQDLLEYTRLLYNWRKTEPVIHNGKTLHFLGRDNTYAFFRYNDNETIFVFLNGAEQERNIPWDHYTEILSKYNKSGVDILTGDPIDTQRPLVAQPLSALVVKFSK